MPGAISLGFSLSYSSKGGALAIAIRKLGLATATKDGSVGQTYSAPAGMTGIQWYREALNSGRAQNAISGATGSTYSATAGDAGFRLVAKGNLSGVFTDAVALQVVYVAPVLLDSFDTLSNYTASNVTLSIDPSAKQGSGSLKIDRTGTGTVLATRTTGFTIDGSTSIDPSTLGVIYMATYVEPQSELQNPVSYVQFNRNGSFVGLVQDADTQNINSNPNPADQALGWHPHNFNVSEHSGLNTAGAGTLSARYRSLPTVRHDALMGRAGGRPTVCLTFDDCFATTATIALPYMDARGLRGTSYTVPLNVGKTNRLSKAQMGQLLAAGWDLACNFTNDDSNITTRPDPTTAATEAAGVRQWLVDNGFDNPGKNHGCYSEGAWSIAGARVALSSCTADGSNVVTVPATDSANIGFTLAGSAIPTGTTITAVVDSTHYQVSQNVPTRAALAAVLIDKRGAFYNGKMQAALAAQGFLTGRTTLYSPSQGHFHSRFGIEQALTLPACSTSMGSGVTVNQLINQYEKAKLRQSTIIYYIHDIAATASAIGMTIVGFQQFMDYIAADVAAGNADNLTISEIWARDGGSSIPV